MIALRPTRQLLAASARCLFAWLPVFLCLAQAPAYANVEVSTASALAFEPRLHPLKLLDAVPGPSGLPERGRQWQISLSHANQFMGGRSGDENLFLDGETTRLSIDAQWPLGTASCWQGGVHLPLIHHGGGRFDRAISDWHDTFGFPDAHRGNSPRDRLSYRYETADGSLQLSESVTALGDVALQLIRHRTCKQDAEGALSNRQAASGAGALRAFWRGGRQRLSVMVPSGDVEKFTGSGNWRASLDWQSRNISLGNRWTLAGFAGLAWLGNSAEFSQRRDLMVQAALGLRYSWTPRFALRAQLDAHSAFYRSGLRELGDPGVTLATGFDWVLPGSERKRLEVSIVEDLAIDTAADIALRVSLVSADQPSH